MLMSSWLRRQEIAKRRWSSSSPSTSRKRNRIGSASTGTHSAIHIESLEERCLLTVTSSFNATTGALMVTSDRSDVIRVGATGRSPFVRVNGQTVVSQSQPVLAANVTRLEVNGGPGRDVIDLSGITSSAFPHLSAAAFRIIVRAGSGNDVITGSPLSDLLSGGIGDDFLVGGDGNDSLAGDDGRDTVWGEAGHDTLRGGNQRDQLDGGTGNDQVFGDLDNDIARGGHGDDTVDGGNGTDLLYGDRGNDSMLGGDGNDRLEGYEGNDTQDGGAGTDVIFGGNGRDLLRGGADNDSLSGQADDDILCGGTGKDTLLGGDGNDGLAGQAGNDRLNGGYGRDTLLGGDGDDCLQGGGGRDLLLGEANNDSLDGQTDPDTLAGGSGLNRFFDPTEIDESATFDAPWLHDGTPVTPETNPPILTSGLMNDTGRSNSDGITSNAAIQGTLTDASSIAVFKAGFDATSSANFTDILSDRQSNGSFALNVTRLNQLNGRTLSDGPHTLHLIAEDAFRNRTTRDVTFTLDTTAPTIARFDLSLTSDTGTVGDHTTTSARVALTGTVSGMALATGSITAESQLVNIQITALGLGTVPNGDGGFQFPDVMLHAGQNSFTVQATDVAGNIATFSRTITRETATPAADPVLTWNRTALEAIKLDASTPPVASRNLAIVSLAMFDAVNAIEDTPAFAAKFTAVAGTSPEAAVAAAAHRALSYLYPAQQAILDAQLATSLSTVPDGTGENNGVTLGNQIADAILAQREDDGYRDFVDYVPGSAPGQWQPTAPMFNVALLPQWADLRPFAMTTSDQFRPAGPPDLTSTEYATAFNEVRRFGKGTGSERTTEQTNIARYWADGPGTFTPAGHWNLIAADVAQQQGNSLAANARLFAQLNVGLADAAIVAWDAKYNYEFWRPETAIQNADLDGNNATTVDPTWQPFLITPPFPEYVSGHSTYSGTAAQILTNVFGNNASFTSDSPGFVNPAGVPVQRTFDNAEQAFPSTFLEAAAEAGQSRIYGGIHFQFANQDGQTAGRALANHVLNRFTVTSDTLAPTVVITSPDPDGVFSTNPTLVGQVFDNLSGVATLVGHVSNVPGPATPITLDPTGHFTFTPSLATNGTADGTYTPDLHRPRRCRQRIDNRLQLHARHARTDDHARRPDQRSRTRPRPNPLRPRRRHRLQHRRALLPLRCRPNRATDHLRPHDRPVQRTARPVATHHRCARTPHRHPRRCRQHDHTDPPRHAPRTDPVRHRVRHAPRRSRRSGRHLPPANLLHPPSRSEHAQREQLFRDRHHRRKASRHDRPRQRRQFRVAVLHESDARRFDDHRSRRWLNHLLSRRRRRAACATDSARRGQRWRIRRHTRISIHDGLAREAFEHISVRHPRRSWS